MATNARRTGSASRISHDLSRTDSATAAHVAETWIVRQYCDAGSLQVCLHRASAGPLARPRRCLQPQQSRSAAAWPASAWIGLQHCDAGSLQVSHAICSECARFLVDGNLLMCVCRLLVPGRSRLPSSAMCTQQGPQNASWQLGSRLYKEGPGKSTDDAARPPCFTCTTPLIRACAASRHARQYGQDSLAMQHPDALPICCRTPSIGACLAPVACWDSQT